MRYIAICNWSTYQHYKDRNPAWIKLHRTLMTSQTWVMLDDASRVLAVSLMMLAAATGNKIPHDFKYLKKVLFLNGEVDLKQLLDTQFIEIIGDEKTASATLADVTKPLDQRRGEESRDRGEAEETRGAVPDDSDQFIENLIALHPRAVNNPKTQQAIVDAIIRESKVRGGDQPAMEYLLDRTRLYRELTDGWPPGKVSKICSAVNWYADSKYTDNEKFWKAEDGNSKQDENSGNLKEAINRRNQIHAGREDGSLHDPQR